MHKGGDGGTGLMDDEVLVKGTLESTLMERNPPPLSKESETMSKQGLKDAWKSRK